MSIAINSVTNFKRLNRTLFFGGELDGTATVRVRESDTTKVLEELYHVDATNAMRLYEKAFTIFAACETALDRLAGE